MKKLLIKVVLFFLISGCSGGNEVRGLAGDNKGDSNNKTNEVCYLGQNSDHKTCVITKPINAEAEGYLDPFTHPNFMGTGNPEQYRRPQNAVILKDYSQNLKLTPSFIMSELMNAEKDSFGIYASAVAVVLQKIRDMAQSAIRVNSSFRSPQYNGEVDGAAKWSRHQYGDAFDISSKSLSLNQLINLCKQLGATYTDKYVAHVHCDWRNKTLETGFFGVASTKEIQQFNQTEFARELSETSVLNISGKVVKGNVIYLSSHVEFKEDAEEIYKKWEILTPSGQILVYESSECAIYLTEPGTYQVRHTIGAHAQVNQHFVVP